jgi:hypothetical protein
LRTVKDTDSAVLDAVKDILDGVFLPTEDIDVEGMGVELTYVGDLGGLVEEELEGKAGDVLGMLVQQGGDDFPSDEAAARDDAGLRVGDGDEYVEGVNEDDVLHGCQHSLRIAEMGM